MKAKRTLSKYIPGIVFSAYFLIIGQSCVSSSFRSQVDQYMNAFVKLGTFSGSILVAQKGKVLVRKGYGSANYEYDIPNTPKTKFRIGSMTKQFTAMAVMQLQEQGKLRVRDSISEYIDDIPDSWKNVTIHQLLTHTSGIPLYYAYPEYAEYCRGPMTPRELIETVMDKPLDFPPGEGCRHSCTGYNILGYIIEKISGMSYAGFLQENIFSPLEMNDSGFDLPSSIVKNRSSGYILNANGELSTAGYIHMSVPYAAGALYSTIEDLYKWDRALYSEKLVSRKSLDAIFTPYAEDSKYGLKSGGGGWSYGYGWILSATNRGAVVHHSGGVNGFTTNIARHVDEDVCIIVLSNREGEGGIVSKISADLAAMLYGIRVDFPQKEERKIILVDPVIYDDYVGKYQYDYIITITKRNNRLYYQGSWQPETEIFPETETKFWLKGARISFVRDDAGKVIHLIYHQSGNDTVCKKID
ncbi:MAG: serine hydrolase [Candidatus Aminicenantes bacterium]|nr:serine hydrolase [Candidatus Aminicenantes bacterium]